MKSVLLDKTLKYKSILSVLKTTVSSGNENKATEIFRDIFLEVSYFQQ
jgi:hypothetical protein